MSSDKSTGQWVGTIVGGVIGFVTGGPAGAFRGAVIGASLGGYIDPPKGPNITGPRLEDLNYQYASYGQPLGRHYGTMASMGSVIWLENDKIKETSRKQKVGGKGGGSKQTLETFSYFAIFAVAFNDGEIAGVRRIWINGQLHYNAASNDLATIIASNQNAEGFRIYRGTDDQDPDPRIEADMGVGNAPAFRGTAYIVFYDLPLEKYGNTLAGAQIKVECYTSDIQFTSSVIDFLEPPNKTGDYNGAMFVPRLTGSSIFGLTVSAMPGFTTYRYDLDSAAFTNLAVFPPAGATIAPDRYVGPAVNLCFFSLATEGVSYYLDTVERKRASIFITMSIDAYEAADGELYLAGQGSSPNRFVISSSKAVIEEPIDSEFSPVCSISYWQEEIFCYVSHMLRVFVYDAVTLSKLREFDLTAQGNGSGRFIHIDNGVLYNYTSSDGGTSNNHMLRGFSVSDGELLFERLLPTWEGAGGDVAFVIYNNLMFRYMPEPVTFTSDDNPGRGCQIVNLNGFSDVGVPLSGVLSDLCLRSEYIAEEDLDLSLIDEDVRGYRVAGVMDARSAIGPLQGVYAFDLLSSGYQIKFKPRGQSVDATVSAQYLNARNYGDASGERIINDRQMDSQLPRQVMLRHIDPQRDYEPNEQPSTERLDARTTRINTLDMPVSMLPDEAAKVAQKLFDAGWLERDDFKFTLPPNYRALDPCDVLTVVDDNTAYELRIGELNYQSNGVIEVNCKPNGVALWTPTAVGGQGSVSDGSVTLIGESTPVLMDIPMILDAMDEPGFTAALYGVGGNAWPGGVLVVSNDSGQTFEGIDAFADQCTVAQTIDSLGPDDGYVIDRVGQLLVRVRAGLFESVTESQMMTGSNICAYGVDGRWEIIQFVNATLQVDGTWLLDTFLRGLRGTEWATGLHQDGDWLVLLNDPDVSFVGSSLAVLGIERIYRAVTVGADVQDAENNLFTYRGVNLKPLSVVHVQGERPENDWLISYVPRTRYSSSAWVTGVEPRNDEPLAFEIDILDGDSVVRTISVAGDSAIYSEEQQIEDFGFVRAVISIVIYQISSRVGRGYPAAVTLGEGLPLGVINFLMVDGEGPVAGSSIEFIMVEDE